MTNNISRSTDGADELVIVDKDDDVARIVTDGSHDREPSGLGITLGRSSNGRITWSGPIVRVADDDLDALLATVQRIVDVRDGEADPNEPLYPEPPYWTDGDTVRIGSHAEYTYIRMGGSWWSFSHRRGFRPSASNDTTMRAEVESRPEAIVRRANA